MVDMAIQDGLLEARLLQVEVNAISAAFSSLGSKAAQLHRYLVSSRPQLFPDLSLENMPENDSHRLVPEALHSAHQHFLVDRSSRLAAGQRVVVMMVAQPGERNRIDQRLIEFEAFQLFGLGFLRSSLAEVAQTARLDSHKNLIM